MIHWQFTVNPIKTISSSLVGPYSSEGNGMALTAGVDPAAYTATNGDLHSKASEIITSH